MSMSPPRLLELLAQQAQHYTQLQKLAMTQHEMICLDRTDMLLDILAQRQVALDEILTLEHELKPVKLGWSEYADGLDSRTRTEAERLLSSAKESLAAITRSDEDDALMLQQRKLNVGKQLVKTGQGRVVNRAYGGAPYGQPGRVDLSK